MIIGDQTALVSLSSEFLLESMEQENQDEKISLQLKDVGDLWFSFETLLFFLRPSRTHINFGVRVHQFRFHCVTCRAAQFQRVGFLNSSNSMAEEEQYGQDEYDEILAAAEIMLQPRATDKKEGKELKETNKEAKDGEKQESKEEPVTISKPPEKKQKGRQGLVIQKYFCLSV